MKQFSEHDYKDIIFGLKKLRSVHASDTLKQQVRTAFIPSLPLMNYSPLLSMGRLVFSTLLVVLLSGTGVVVASQKSQPGDALYPIKKVAEKIQLSLTRNPTAKTLLHINNAEKRIEELQKTIQKENREEIKNVTTDYESQVKDALREIKKVQEDKKDVSNEVNQHLENQTQNLQDIQKIAPTASVVDVQKAIETSKTREENRLEDSPKPSVPLLEQ
ncbi:hypothetical protein HZC27_00190 [Candidatus Roizmanbacteria bacterium]|nr:hypothetical protein [Candidatus Roizmanbacteria bacterium]